MAPRRTYFRADGWTPVVVTALVGLALAALVVLTPWHVEDLPGGGGSGGGPRMDRATSAALVADGDRGGRHAVGARPAPSGPPTGRPIGPPTGGPARLGTDATTAAVDVDLVCARPRAATAIPTPARP